MFINVDPSNPVPVYSQITQQIKHAIASGVLRPGDLLPSLRDLAKEIRINPHTVARAYRELETSGLVRTDQGRGTSVIGDGAGLSATRRREEIARLCHQVAVEGYHLGASPDEIVSILRDELDRMLPEFESRDKSMKEGRK